MKRCSKCQQVKPTECFYKHAAMRDGLCPRCKDCSRESRGFVSEKNRKYASSDYGKAKRAKLAREYKERNPVKTAARKAVYGEIRAGRIIRRPCEVCGDDKAQAHHDDYGKPLDVRWLCTTHHTEWHRHNTPKYPKEDAARPEAGAL